MAQVKLMVFLLFTSIISLAKGNHQYEDDLDFDPYVEKINSHSEYLRIAGGSSITIDKSPFAVIVRVSNRTLCGGVILAPTWVLTAAHCLYNAAISDITIRAGTDLLDVGGFVITANTIFIHSAFRDKIFDYDYGLILLNQTLNFTSNIAKIAIPNQDQNLPLVGPVLLNGWGMTSDQSNAFSATLRQVKAMVIPRAICRLMYGRTANITDRMFCAGKFLIGGKGSCAGDSGGPVVYNNVAVGIMSFGTSCGSAKYPSVLAAIAPVTGWIKGITGI